MAVCSRSRIPVSGAGGKSQIRLTLRKPPDWKVKLTTSSCSSSIAIPDITLRDERGRILIDTSVAKKSIHQTKSPRRETAKSKKSGNKTNIPIIIKTDWSEAKPEGRKTSGTSTAPRTSGNAVMPKTKLKSELSIADSGGELSLKHKKNQQRQHSRIPCLRKRSPEKIPGDFFPEAKSGAEESSEFARATSQIIRVRGSSNRKGKNDGTSGVRRSKRRIVSAKDGMGSNVSRHSGKGLSGRRTQSSSNLCHGAKILAPSVGRILNSCGAGGVSNRDRNKFCGSLPNHLDEKELRSGECTPESLYSVNNNYEETYTHPSREKNVELLFHKLAPREQHQQDFSGGDQGYASERSPEEEVPPPLPSSDPPSQPYSTLRRNREFPFVTKENTYEARLEKGSRGLGLSVTGGIDTEDKYPGLIRIKRIFPHQPAWECKLLQVGDIILAANGIPLTGLTNYEALEVLRTTPNDVVLKVCRPPGDIFAMPPQVPGEPPPPPRRDPAHVISSSQVNASSTLPLPQLIAEPYEFEIVLRKVNGSLGFMLRKEDESVLGHCVRALVREPALSDGRIRPGDKIVTVNGVDISPMSHEEAVMYLRQCGEEVRLRLYRDPAQTPVSALSPTESYKTFRPKPVLRKEAMDMLCDLAVKKLSPSDSSSSSGRSRLKGSSPGTSPRRRKLTKAPVEPGDLDDRPRRPDFLDLGGDGTLGRDDFRESVGPEEDSDSILPATSGSEVPRTTVGSATRACVSSDECNSEDGAFPSEPVSMPPMTSSVSAFSYKNPAYQSAHPAVHSETENGSGERLSDQDIPDSVFNEGGSHGLLKWKGVLFTPEDGVGEDKRSSEMKHSNEKLEDDQEVLTVELCRGWNSRLGFSLQSSDTGTCISAIYADSVAAKDGRLQPGDRVITINDESTEEMSTSDVIDLLRKIRGTIAITVRRNGKES